MKKIVAFIFARGGSKRIPNKNLALLCGESLLSRAIRIAQDVPGVIRVVVSTDDAKISAHATECGAEVLLRPPELTQDASPEHASWQHAVRETRAAGVEFDAMLVLTTTSPLRSRKDVEECVRVFGAHPGTDIVLTIREPECNPYYNMITFNPDGTIRMAIENEHNKARLRRQDAPPIFDVTTVAYVVDPDFVLRAKHCLDGKARAVEVPRIRAVDIDVPLDLEWAEFLLRRGHPDLQP